MSARVRGVLIFCVLSRTLAAQPAHSEPKDCSSRRSTFEQRQCAEEALRTSDAEVAAAFHEVMEHLAKIETSQNAAQSPDGKSWSLAVADSQRTWKAYRDAECRGVVGFGDGSGRMVWVLECLAEKNALRVKELKVPYDQR